MNLEKERELFLKSKTIGMIKFNTLEYFMDGNLIIFKDKTLNLMWHAWLASASREGYKMVPVELPKEYEIKLLENNLFPCLDDIHDMYKAMIGAANET